VLDGRRRARERTVARLARRPQVDGKRGLQLRGGSEDQVLAGRGVLVQPPYQTRSWLVPASKQECAAASSSYC
jgi:hypothetical protein